MSVTLLCIGDIHLGRKTGGLPEGVDPREADPKAAWERFVDLVLREKPDAAVLTGDVVDQNNRYFEAYGPLENGVRRLADAGIPVFAVAGNHDFEVFTRLAGRIEGFTLLGAGGVWRERALERDGRVLAYLRGLSFHQRHLKDDPMQHYRFEPRPGAPVVGVLHTELDAPGSPYLPVSTADLAATDVSCWLLGHVHVPGPRRESPLILYCGSPQGLDVTETGAHGAWRVHASEHGASAELIPLAGVRFEFEDMPLDGATEDEEFESAVLDATARVARRTADSLGPARTVVCRLRAMGRTSLRARIPVLAENLGALAREFDGVTVAVESVVNAARPALDLAALASDKNPLGLLAARLLVLDAREPAADYDRLIDEAVARLAKIEAKAYYKQLSDDEPPPPDREEVRALLLSAGLDALEALKATGEGA